MYLYALFECAHSIFIVFFFLFIYSLFFERVTLISAVFIIRPLNKASLYTTRTELS